MRGKSDFDSLRKDLDRFWAEALAYDALGEIPSAQVDAIEQVFTSSTKAYAHALITQLLAKLNDPIRDARCIQRIKGLDDPRRFDARSICAKVVVPWERSRAHLKIAFGSERAGFRVQARRRTRA
jgi:hypothetical protein